MLHNYRFAGQLLTSCVELPTLQKAETSIGSSLQIALSAVSSEATEAAWNHQWRQPDGSVTLSMSRLDGGYLLRATGLCDFLFSPASRQLTIQPLVPLEANSIEHLLLDQILPRLLAHAGQLPLHAAMIAIDGEAILLLGESGAGKSTLAAALDAAGHRVLSDDCVVLRVDADAVTAIPTYPSLRLNPDSLGQLEARGEGSQPMAEYSDKRRLKLDPHAADSDGLPVRAVYWLDCQAEVPTVCRIDAMSPVHACIEMMKQGFALDIADRAQMAGLLQGFSEAARKVPAFGLCYPRRYEAIPEALDCLIDHARQLGS